MCLKCLRKMTMKTDKFTLFVYLQYSFLSRYHYTKSKNYLKRLYRIRHWIPMFIGTPCTFHSFFTKIQLKLLIGRDRNKIKILNIQVQIKVAYPETQMQYPWLIISYIWCRNQQKKTRLSLWIVDGHLLIGG